MHQPSHEQIDTILAARQRGDMAALESHFAPGATYRLAVSPRVFPPFGNGAVDARAAVAGLVDQFQFQEIERLRTLIQGNVAMVHWRIRASVRGGVPEDSELFDIWTFDETGRIESIVEFADTALMVQMLG